MSILRSKVASLEADARSSDMEFGDLQEVIRLLELREEYIAFIADLESELAYLKHFMDCKLCWEKAKMMVNRERGEDIWWNNLFSRMLPESLGEDQVLVESCPRLDDYGRLDAFIAARVKMEDTTGRRHPRGC